MNLASCSLPKTWKPFRAHPWDYRINFESILSFEKGAFSMQLKSSIIDDTIQDSKESLQGKSVWNADLFKRTNHNQTESYEEKDETFAEISKFQTN